MRNLSCFLIFLLIPIESRGQETPPVSVTVALDGSGNVRSIQEALESIPSDRFALTILNIRNGEYKEKLFITKSNIALVGEDQEKTRIIYPILRSEWVAQHDGDDWGSGVVNIGDGVHDVIFANLTVRNTFGDSAKSHDHQFAIRGFDATRISLLYCTVSSAGGDALSLWNRESGMYYHTNCSFEGWVDYVCPRGWCYITDSKFFGYNRPSASIWHDGSADRDQKFVIRYSNFDGVPGFPLGRHHRDAQFFLLDCRFSKNMADKPLYAPVSPNTVEWVWGARHYFWNCSRDGEPFDWFADNLATAEGSPVEKQITPVWTFAGKWDPERTLPPLLPFAVIPHPRSGDYGISPRTAKLSWIPARNAEAQSILFGEQDKPQTETKLLHSSFETGNLTPGTIYTWRIRSMIAGKRSDGPLWTFTTAE